MTRKYSVLINYKYLEYMENAGLSDADSWVLMRSVIEYDRSGAEPEYDNPVLYGLFAVIKHDIDQRRENYEEVCRSRSEAGKKGGAGKGNQNARKNRQNDQKQAIACFAEENKQNRQKQPDLDQDMDQDYDPGSEENNNNKGGGDFPENPGNENPPCLPEPENAVGEKSREILGLYVGKAYAKKIAENLPEPWINGSPSFFDFLAERIPELYPGRPPGEKQKIFVSALSDGKKWDNLRREYPAWKTGREKKLREKAAAEAEEEAMRLPEKCPLCGERLEGQVCGSCGSFVFYDGEKKEWGLESRETRDNALALLAGMKRTAAG